MRKPAPPVKQLSYSATPIAPGFWRQVVKVTEHPNPGFEKHWAVGGSKRLWLDCGHDGWCKMSRATPKRSKCRSCIALGNAGSVATRFDVKAGIAHEEYIEGQSLIRLTRKMTKAEVREWTRDIVPRSGWRRE